MSINTVETGQTVHVPSVAHDVRSLEQRLERGWRIIDEKKAQGQDVEALEEHWLSLLADYEALCRRPDEDLR